MFNVLFHTPIIAFLLLFIILFYWQVYSQQKGQSLNKRLAISLVLGLLMGFVVRLFCLHYQECAEVMHSLFQIISGTYFALLKMLVIPLILFSIISAILGFKDNTQETGAARVAMTSVFILLVTTSIAAGIAGVVTMQLHLGANLSLGSESIKSLHHYTGFVDAILGMLPANPILAMNNENTVAIVILAVLLGVSALTLYKAEPKSVDQFKSLVDSVFAVIKQLTRFVIALTPYGVFALIAEFSSSSGFSALEHLFFYVAAIYFIFLLVLLMHFVLLAFRGCGPIRYLKGVYMPFIVAFMTRSSFATLPVAQQALRKEFGRSKLVSTFVPSIGATLGMNACAGIFPAVVAIMTMQAMGLPVTLVVIAKIMVVNAIASLGISGIPGTAFIAASVSLSLLGLPFNLLALVLAVDPIVDMGRTTVNVSGSLTAALVASKRLEATELGKT